MLVYVLISMERKPPQPLPVDPHSALGGSFIDPDTGHEVAYGVDHSPGGLALSFAAGNVSGLLGVGGGAIKVPVMTLLHARAVARRHRHEQPHDRRHGGHRRAHLLRPWSVEPRYAVPARSASWSGRSSARAWPAA